MILLQSFYNPNQVSVIWFWLIFPFHSTHNYRTLAFRTQDLSIFRIFRLCTQWSFKLTPKFSKVIRIWHICSNDTAKNFDIAIGDIFRQSTLKFSTRIWRGPNLMPLADMIIGVIRLIYHVTFPRLLSLLSTHCCQNFDFIHKSKNWTLKPIISIQETTI